MLEPSARDRILAAALTEFATRGYEAASTNAIAAQAGVAKGLVFHHFGSKEQLFVAVFDVQVERFSAQVLDLKGPPSTDLFERLHQITMRKLELSARHPMTVDFILVALTEAPAPLRATLLAKQAALLQSGWPKVMEGLDASRLRPGLAIGDAVETVGLLAEGLEKQLTALLKNKALSMDAIAAKAWRHFERLRDGLYRH